MTLSMNDSSFHVPVNQRSGQFSLPAHSNHSFVSSVHISAVEYLGPQYFGLKVTVSCS